MRRLVVRLLLGHARSLARPELFRFTAVVAGMLAAVVSTHEHDDVDATEQHAIAHLGRTLRLLADVAIETAELFDP